MVVVNGHLGVGTHLGMSDLRKLIKNQCAFVVRRCILEKISAAHKAIHHIKK